MLKRELLLPALMLTALAWAQSAPVTEVLFTDPAVTYNGIWYTNNSSANTGGLAALTNAKDAMASITFTGAGITWFGVIDPGSGVAWVFLDGTVTTVDTWGPATLYQQPLFTIQNLGPGPHTLAVEVPHVRHPGGTGSWIWIDHFEIENGATVLNGTSATEGRVEETNPAVITTGAWYSKPDPVFSGGTSIFTGVAGAQATLRFTGTSVIWLAYEDQWSGIANVYLDGVLQSSVDTYQPAAEAEVPVFVAAGLADGPHTLTIEVTGTNNPSSGGASIWVDAFQIVGSTSLPIVPIGPPTVVARGKMLDRYGRMPRTDWHCWMVLRRLGGDRLS